jgi:hypothetical protein
MSSGAGHIMDMIQRMKQNRSLKPSKRNKFKDNNRETIHVNDSEQEQLNFPVVSEEELHRIKLQIRYEALRQRKKERVAYGIAIFVVTILMLLLLLWV